MTEADYIVSYLLDQGLVDRPKKDEIVITGKGKLVWKILGHIVEKDGVDTS